MVKNACPICGRPMTAEFAPFCSKRCRMVDLGRWLSDGYAVESAEPEEPPPSAGSDED